MAEGTAAAAGNLPEAGGALVNAELQRSLRAAERPSLPDGGETPPVLVAHVSDRVVATSMAAAAQPDGSVAASAEAPGLPGGDAAGPALSARLPAGSPASAAAAVGTSPAAAGVAGLGAVPLRAAPSSSPPPEAVAPATGSLPPAAGPNDAGRLAPAAAPAAPDQVAGTASVATTESLPAAEAARLVVRDAATSEDAPVGLDIAASFAGFGAQGSTLLAVVIAGLPAGTRLSAGSLQPDGTWLLDPGDLAGLQLIPPRDWSGEVTLLVRAITVGPLGDRAETTASLQLVVEAVADAPFVSATASGPEDGAIPLVLDVRATDLDGSEVISAIWITGVPAEASLSAGVRGDDGVWRLLPADLDGLRLTPPPHFAGDIALAVGAQSREPNGSTATTTLPITVRVGAVADPPLATAADGSGTEDSWIPLAGLSAALVDQDGSEQLSVAIIGLPPDAEFSAGTRLADGTWQVPREALAALAVRTAEHFSGTLSLALRATAHESGAGVPDATTTVPFTLSVTPVVDQATITGSAPGAEDSWIAIGVTMTTPDTDGSEQWAATSVIAGMPAGAQLSEGIEIAPGTWQVDTARLQGGVIAVRPPPDSDADFTLTVTSVLTDSGAGMSESASFVGNVTVRVAAVADAPEVSVRDATGAEDSWIALAGLAAGLADRDGSEMLEVRILGVPDGAALSAGVRLPDGSWQVAAADLAGLALRPPEDFAGSIALILRATATEADPAAEVPAAVVELPFLVTVTPVVDGAAIAGSAQGDEDSWITLNGSLGVPSDPSELWADLITIADLPPGAVLNLGTDLGGGVWRVARDDFTAGRVAIRPPPDSDADFVLTLSGQLIDAEGGMSAARSISAPLPVSVRAIADAPVATARDAVGQEDSAIPLDLTALLSDADGSETLGISVSGVPAGASLSAGSRQADGTWLVPPDALPGLSLTPPAHLSGRIALSMTVTGTEARDDSSAGVTLPFSVTVTPVADAGSLAGSAKGKEDSWIQLKAAFSTPDADGSESLGAFTTISGVPGGAVLSQGRAIAPGSWQVPTSELVAGRIAIRPPADSDADFTLTLGATLIDRSGGTTASASILPELRSQILSGGGIGQAGILFGAPSASGSNWNTTSMGNIDVDGDGVFDGSVLRITNFTTGGLTFNVTSAGVGPMAGNVWVAPKSSLFLYLPDAAPATMVTTLAGGGSSKLSDTKAIGPNEFDWSAPRTTGGLTDTRAIGGTLSVVVTAVADTPSVFATDSGGLEDSWIALNGLGGALRDTDGSESLSFRLHGLPAGARLSAGSRQPDGGWLLTPAQLAGLSMRPPEHFAGTLDLTLTAIATEARDGRSSASSSTGFRVVIDPVADEGVIVGGGAGREDSWITLGPLFVTPDADGSERWGATTVISGVPDGATLSHGIRIGPGSWEVATSALQAGSVAILPPPHSDADLVLQLTTTLSDTANGRTDTRTVSGSITVAVTAVADAPDISVADTRGAEDTWIPLTGLAAALVDGDGSETLSVTLSGVPAGAALSAGRDLGGGIWQVDAGDLAGLRLLPPPDFSGTIRLSLAATATDNDAGMATSTGLFDLVVDAVADVPTLRVAPARGLEDSAIPLAISGRAVDLDGSETLTHFRIADVPAGAVLTSAGAMLAPQADGSYLVPASLAGGLAIRPPPDSDVDFVLRVSAIAAEPNGSTAETTPQPLAVRVLGVADAPLGLAGGGRGSEDVPVPLNISAHLSDTDGSERLHFVVSGVPAGMSLSAGTYAGPGRWSLTAEEAAGAALITPRDWSGQVTLTLTAVAQEQDGGSSATSSIPITLDVAAVVDAPAIVGASGTRWATARGPEDSWIPLNLDPGLRDSDGSERVIGTVEIGGLPPGAALGYRDGTVLTPSAGQYAIPVARIGDVMVRPPADSDVAFDLSVRMTIADTGGVQERFAGLLRVDPEGRADAPVFGVTDVQGAGPARNRPQDGPIAVPITLAASDTDGSEAARLILRDVPAGFLPSAGRNMGDGVWVLEPGQHQDLTIRPPFGFAGTVTLTAEALVVEREGDALRTALPLRLTVTPGDDGNNGHGNDPGGYDPSNPGQGNGKGPGNNAGGGNGQGNGNGQDNPDPPPAPALSVVLSDGREDTPLGLSIVGTAGAGGGTVALSYVVQGLPAGARLSNGFHDPLTDRWLLSAAELPGLQLIPPADHAGPISVQVIAIATDRIGQTARTTRTDDAMIEAVADLPQIAAAPASGLEDMVVPLNLAATPGDRDGSEQIVSVVVSNLPAGARLVGPGLTDNGNGSFSVDPAALGSLGVLPPANAHGSFTLTVTATAIEASNGSTRTTSRSVGFAIAADPDAPVLIASDAGGVEDSEIPLALGAALADTDGSEVLSAVIAGLPPGSILSAGVNNGDGSWTLLPGQLAALTLTPPADFSGAINATLIGHAMERSTGSVATSTMPFSITVAPVADAPMIAAPERVRGTEDTALPVGLQARLADTDGSEILTVLATDVPAFGRFSAGTANPDGSWSFTTAELPGLAFIPPADFSGQLSLRFTAIATEPNGTAASVSQTVTFIVDPTADAPLLAAAAAAGDEDAAIPLSISATLADTDGSETLDAVIIDGLPEGFRLSAGMSLGGGSYSVAVEALAGLALLAPPDWNGTLQLSVTAAARESAGGTASATVPLTVTVHPVNDAPELSVLPAAPVTAGNPMAPVAAMVSATDIDGDPVAAALITLGDGRHADDALMVQGFALHSVDGRIMIGDTGIELVGGGFNGATGQLALAGEASQATYQAVLGALALVNAHGGAPEAGDRQIAIELRDPAGASDIETVTVAVLPSILVGDGSDATLVGTGAQDTFRGSQGNETMLGGTGNDLFLLAIGGGHDMVDGGEGHDTIALSGVVGGPMTDAPPPNGWQLVLDPGAPEPVQGNGSLDFNEPVSGHIVMGDGTQVDFSGIERITW